METQDCLLSRRSVRRYVDRPIPRETLEEIVDAARFAPSWNNQREVRYLCVLDPVRKDKLAALSGAFNKPHIQPAAALFVVLGKRDCVGLEPGSPDGVYYHKSKEWLMLDAGIAIQTLCLAAWDRGVGTLIMGSFGGEAIRDYLQIPEEDELIALVSAGYPAETPVVPQHRTVEESVQFL